MSKEEAPPNGKRIALALSGGGFRATLFHLGGVRFLHEAQILQHVTHISSVSGGSILAAHMAINWDKYTGSEEDFNTIAAEIIQFSRIDVRNKILRRLPIMLPIFLLSQIIRTGKQRNFTRVGLLEKLYDTYLYRKKCMYELEKNPTLNILTTNVSQGCLCSFTPTGFTFLGRDNQQSSSGNHIRAGLTPVSLAVTASSAFPGFFPTVDISNQEIGAEEGEFHAQSFTDGGAYDNLGIRIFKWIKESWFERNDPLRREDILDTTRFLNVLKQDKKKTSKIEIAWLSDQLKIDANTEQDCESATSQDGIDFDRIVQILSRILIQNKLYLEEDWKGVKLIERDAALLLTYARSSDRDLDQVNHLWLNRQLLESALNNIDGKPIIRQFDGGFDTILASDAGQQFRVVNKPRFSWLFGTAIRAADILYDRVGQLELENAENDPSFLFARISDIVYPSDDTTAPHPVVQRRLAHVRTDFDSFSPEEISALIQHGYCIYRNSCKTRPDIFGSDLPTCSPWDPTHNFLSLRDRFRNWFTFKFLNRTNKNSIKEKNDKSITHQARTLQGSAQRRLWSTILNLSDWPTYIYIPLLLILFFVIPILTTEAIKQSIMNDKLVNAIASGNDDFRIVNKLLKNGPKNIQPNSIQPSLTSLSKPDYSGFEFLKDVRIIDLRDWKEVAPEKSGEIFSPAVWIRRTRIKRKPDQENNDRIRFQYRTTGIGIDLRCITEGLKYHVQRAEELDTVHGRTTSVWEIEIEVDKVSIGNEVDIVTEAIFWNGFQGKEEEWAGLRTDTHTEFSGMWILFPESKPYKKYRLKSYQTDVISEKKQVNPVHEIDHPDNTIIGWSVTNAKAGYTYECQWTW